MQLDADQDINAWFFLGSHLYIKYSAKDKHCGKRPVIGKKKTYTWNLYLLDMPGCIIHEFDRKGIMHLGSCVPEYLK